MKGLFNYFFTAGLSLNYQINLNIRPVGKLLGRRVIFSVLMVFFIPAITMALNIKTPLKICDDGSEWPPYTHFERVNGKKTNKIIGFSVEVISTILKAEGLQHEIELPPWSRCLKSIREGNDFVMALNASYSEERRRSYWMTNPYYSTTNYYFYSKATYPEGLNVKKKADLLNYKICGMHGYNYSTYGVAKNQIDQQAHDFTQLINKLHRKRCDLFLEKYEILVGFSAIGKNYLSDSNLGSAVVPEMKSTPFYMLISKKVSYGKELKELINRGVERMKRNGKMEELMKKYQLLR